MANFIVDDFRIAYVFDIAEPIPETKLAGVLEERGFSVQKNRYFLAPNSPIRVSILNIATKGKTSILYQKDNPPTFIGVSGKDTTEALKQFDVLENMLQSADPTLLQQKSSIEAVITGKKFSEKVPEKEIPKLAGDRVSELGKALGTPLRLLSVLIAPEKESEKKWSIRIEPLVGSAKYYFIQYLIKGTDRATVLADAYRSVEVINDIVAHIEV